VDEKLVQYSHLTVLNQWFGCCSGRRFTAQSQFTQINGEILSSLYFLINSGSGIASHQLTGVDTIVPILYLLDKGA
jgi:hypothetical protein